MPVGRIVFFRHLFVRRLQVVRLDGVFGQVFVGFVRLLMLCHENRNRGLLRCDYTRCQARDNTRLARATFTVPCVSEILPRILRLVRDGSVSIAWK